MNKNTCCFLGHRKIKITNTLKHKLHTIIEDLIIKKNVDTFLFGSKSQFDDLCYQIVSELMSVYSHIKRIYVRSHFQCIDNDYKTFLLQSYEETYYPDNIIKSGKSAYIKRNFEMINNSKFCIMYFDQNYAPPQRKKSATDLNTYQPKSGTKIAYEYAQKQKKIIINVFNELKHLE